MDGTKLIYDSESKSEDSDSKGTNYGWLEEELIRNMQPGSTDVADNGPHHIIKEYKSPTTSTCNRATE
jgi:hypothetical protein